ncbi:MAG: hypothetical protein ACO3EO_07065, partial [Candidatus Kapaibacteriota bacterium]
MKQLNESHPAMSCIGNFTSDELSSKLNEDGFPSYRGKQLFHALYTRNHNTTFSFDTINTLPADLRNALLDKYGSD